VIVFPLVPAPENVRGEAAVPPPVMVPSGGPLIVGIVMGGEETEITGDAFMATSAAPDPDPDLVCVVKVHALASLLAVGQVIDGTGTPVYVRLNPECGL
jgi:hypothetical protein